MFALKFVPRFLTRFCFGHCRSTHARTAPKMSRQPTFYIPHGGGPCFFMDWAIGPKDTWKPLEKWLRRLPRLLPETPKAIVIVSGHWEAKVPTVTGAASPRLIYDYSGFPRHTYQLKMACIG